MKNNISINPQNIEYYDFWWKPMIFDASENIFSVLEKDWVKKIGDLDEIRAAKKITSRWFAQKFPETEKYLWDILDYDGL